MPTVHAPASKSGYPDSVESRYADVCRRIAASAAKAGRRASDIILVAVTKTADPEQIRTLLQLGHRDFGESRAQVLVQHAAVVAEYLDRQRLAPSARRVPAESGDSLFGPHGAKLCAAPTAPGGRDGVRWHMIGHLQRNKARKVIEYVRLVHSVDSLRLAEELQAIAVKRDEPVEVLLQVNTSGESQKFGCPQAAAVPLAEQIATMVNVRLRGLMTMAAYSPNPEDARGAFARCRELFEEMSVMGFGEQAPFNILSMGMTGDFEVGISEGANIVRIGTAIFGEAKSGVEHAEAPEPEEEGKI
ncbi:Pyridoxal phosphate homeostasis protein [Phycisphaerales bacterium]|nr:Pyridoxal phosphate homeostasis protein [Phycisphaerales bacterium]